VFNPTFLYVAAVYAGAVALARRAKVELPWSVAALFYALVLAFFFKPMTGPYVNVAPDVLQLIPPWSASAPPGFDKFDVSNYELQDIVFQFIPWTKQVHDQWRSLRVPLWNPLAGCGMPLLANMQSGALSPLRLLTVPLPLAYAFTAEGALKVLVALTFTFLYCRRRYDVLPSIIGAISFGFGTFLMLWLHFPHPNVAVFLPAVLYAIDLLAEQRTFGRVMFAAALGPIVLGGGHPETVAHIVFFAALYVLWLTFVEWVRLLRTIALVGVLSLLLAAPILAPFLEVLPNTMSYGAAKAEERGSATAFSDFASLALLVHPRLYGERPAPVWGPAVTETVSGFAGILGIGACLGLLVRAIAQRRFRERELFSVIATLLMFAIIDDTAFLAAPFRSLFSLALNARFRLQFSFLLAIQAAALVHYARREHVAPLIAAIGGSFAALAFVFAKTSFPSVETQRFALEAAVPSAIVLAVAALLVIRPIRIIVVPLLAAAVYAELWQASHRWHPVSRGTNVYPRTPLVDALLQRRTSEPYRIAGIGAPLFPNTHAVFNFEDVRVKDAIASARYLDVLKTRTRSFDATAYYQKLNDPDTPLLDELNVRWLVTEPRVEVDRAHYRLVYDGADGRVWENLRVKPRFHSPGAFIRIAEARGDRYELHVEARAPARILSSVAYWPGWRVTHEGRALEPRVVGGAFLGFDVPGSGIVRVRYRPLSFWIGAIVALATTALAVLFRALRPDPRAL
jgi:hypothetical protein